MNRITTTAIIFITFFTLLGCRKTDASPDNQSTANNSKNISLDYVLTWTVDNVTYDCYGNLESNFFEIRIDTHLVAKYNYLDNHVVSIDPDDRNFKLTYESLEVEDLSFYITDIDVVGETVSFKFKANDEILNSFSMTGNAGFVGAVLYNLQEEDPDGPNPSKTYSPDLPYHLFFHNGLNKLLLDISLYRFNPEEEDPIFYNNAYNCHRAMSFHASTCNMGYIHNLTHIIPHTDCILTCNNNVINLH